MLSRGEQGTAIDQKMGITFTVSAVCARLTGEYDFFPGGWKSLKWSTRHSRKTWVRCFLARPSPTLMSGERSGTVTIVGVDEADLDRGQVSWVSPIARALMKAREGDILEVRTPAGIEHIEVLDIRYSGSDGDQQH